MISSSSSFFGSEIYTPYESLSSRGRVIIGGVCGAVLGVLYAVVANTIDLGLMRDVPLRVDWVALGWAVGVNGIGGAVLGGLTCAPASVMRGLIAGGVFVAASNLVRALFQPSLNFVSFFLVLLYILLPIVVLMLPLIGGLRYAMHWYERSLEYSGAPRQVRQGQLWMVLVVVGIFAGTWAQMPAETREAVRRVNELVRSNVGTSATTSLPIALRDVPGFRERASKVYELDQQSSISFANGVDVRVYFQTGLVITCSVDGTTRNIFCAEGAKNPYGRFNPLEKR